MNNMEVQAFPNKEARNAVYTDLRQNGDSCERQVVRFSDSEEIAVENVELRQSLGIRGVYRTIYCLAYPRSLGELTGRALRREKKQANV